MMRGSDRLQFEFAEEYPATLNACLRRLGKYVVLFVIGAHKVNRASNYVVFQLDVELRFRFLSEIPENSSNKIFEQHSPANTSVPRRPRLLRNDFRDWKDVASVVPGERPIYNIVTANGHDAVLVNVLQQPDGNAVTIADAVNKELAAIRQSLPRDSRRSTTNPYSYAIPSGA
jgi:AcrB/AcrD/AcrF family